MLYRVYDGTKAPAMAEQLHKAGFYHPDPKQDMWAFGLLLFFVFKGKGQLPPEHEKAIQDGTSVRFASKLYKTGKYTEWKQQVVSEAATDCKNDCDLLSRHNLG